MANIRKRGAGYQAQVRIRGFQPLTHSFKTKADAVQWANEREAEVRRGTYVDTRSLRAEWLLTAVGSKGRHGGNPARSLILCPLTFFGQTSRFPMARMQCYRSATRASTPATIALASWSE